MSHDLELAKLRDALNSHPGLVLELTPLQALTVLGHIQLALRHPHRGPSSAIARAVADSLIRRLAVGDAEIEEVLRRGD